MNNDQQIEVLQLSTSLYRLCGKEKNRQKKKRKWSGGAAGKKRVIKDIADAAAATVSTAVQAKNDFAGDGTAMGVAQSKDNGEEQNDAAIVAVVTLKAVVSPQKLLVLKIDETTIAATVQAKNDSAGEVAVAARNKDNREEQKDATTVVVVIQEALDSPHKLLVLTIDETDAPTAVQDKNNFSGDGTATGAENEVNVNQEAVDSSRELPVLTRESRLILTGPINGICYLLFVGTSGGK